MARTSKTEYAILGLLSLDSMSGYDMKAFIEQSIGFFWQESYGQIYPALRQLLEKDLVSREIHGKPGRPDRHVYTITPAGRERLVEWMESETAPERVRHELLLKLFFGPEAAPEIHEQQIEALMDQQLGRLEQFAQVEKGILREWEGSRYHPYWRATLRYGVHVTRARVKWCRETLKHLKEIEEK